jgi:ribonuclease HII
MPDLSYEIQAHADGYAVVCGIDEAGRGPLAGPVYAAAVILPENCEIPGVNDSKKLSPKKRGQLFDIICEKAVSFGIGTASPAEIDEINILQADFLAMSRAVDGLAVVPSAALVDGNAAPHLVCPVKTIIKGDSLSLSVAAASILAKVSRDRYMEKAAETYPQYGFEKHKGYGTAYHYQMIKEYGPCAIHRMSFLKNLDEH